MKNQVKYCDDARLRTLLDTEASNEMRGRLIAHLDDCKQCQIRLRELAANDDEWRKASEALAMVQNSESSAVGSSDSHSIKWSEPMVRQLLEPPTHPELLGRLGRYDIERLIGSGGMGVVFKAYDSELNRPVAIKLLAPYLAANGSARKRFAREARSAAGVVDDHVVPIFNVEPDNEPPFLVMQYVAGGSLQEVLDRNGPLDVAEILRIGLQAAKGLAAAHAQGLIHRDVKLSNILLDECVERALLTDFGLARTENDAGLTRSGFHPGTPNYMSPEQVRGEAIDARSDLFGLGCVMYALCTGHTPFRAETSYAVLRCITDETPRSIREINPTIPDWLERIVLTLLSKSPADRFHSSSEVAEILEICLAHIQQPTIVSLPDDLKDVASQTTRNRIASHKVQHHGKPSQQSKRFRIDTALTVAIVLLLSAFLAALGIVKRTIDEASTPGNDRGTLSASALGSLINRESRQRTNDESTSQVEFTEPRGMRVNHRTPDHPKMLFVCPERMNLTRGETHQLHVTNVPDMEAAEFEATINLQAATDVTTAFMDHNVISISLAKEDFDQAMVGNLVTKVFYLPKKTGVTDRLEFITSTKIDPGINPLDAAEERGAVVAILRLVKRPTPLVPNEFD